MPEDTAGDAASRANRRRGGHHRGLFLRGPGVPALRGVPRARRCSATPASTSGPRPTGPGSGPSRPAALDWFRTWDTVLEWDLPFARWFDGGTLNVSYNCLDRHVAAGRGDTVAFHWEGEPGDTRTITYAPAAGRRVPVRQRAARPRRRPGRPGGHLHADDPRAAGGHAGLHPHRGRPLGGVRRVLVGRPAGPDPRRPGPRWWSPPTVASAAGRRPGSRPTWTWPCPSRRASTTWWWPAGSARATPVVARPWRPGPRPLVARTAER